jgi:hypothetical protein
MKGTSVNNGTSAKVPSGRLPDVSGRWAGATDAEQAMLIEQTHAAAIKENGDRNAREFDRVQRVYNDAVGYRGEHGRIYDWKKAEMLAYAEKAERERRVSNPLRDILTEVGEHVDPREVSVVFSFPTDGVGRSLPIRDEAGRIRVCETDGKRVGWARLADVEWTDTLP